MKTSEHTTFVNFFQTCKLTVSAQHLFICAQQIKVLVQSNTSKWSFFSNPTAFLQPLLFLAHFSSLHVFLQIIKHVTSFSLLPNFYLRTHYPSNGWKKNPTIINVLSYCQIQAYTVYGRNGVMENFNGFVPVTFLKFLKPITGLFVMGCRHTRPWESCFLVSKLYPGQVQIPPIYILC